MKKFLLTFTTTIFLTITKISAVTIPSPISGDFLSNFTRLTSFIPAILVLTVIGVFAWGAFVRMKAGYDDEEIKNANKIMVGAVVGLIAFLLGPSIIDFIGLLFGLDDIIDINS